jgi:hypothetical protein
MSRRSSAERAPRRGTDPSARISVATRRSLAEPYDEREPLDLTVMLAVCFRHEERAMWKRRDL